VTTYDSGYQVYGVPVVNNQGHELPSTGAEGTMMLITLGTLITIGFAVLLITQKKMTTYHD
jgi:LPXTG-motif cell wall-anchored protein